jgi:hypothetical protein
MSTTLPRAAARPRPSATRTRRGIACIELNNGLWRITRDNGAVLGYIEQLAASDLREGDGMDRFQAKRLASTGRSFVSAGEFWSFDDAVDCLRFS